MSRHAWRLNQDSAALTVCSGVGLAGSWQGVRGFVVSDGGSEAGDDAHFIIIQVSNATTLGVALVISEDSVQKID